MRTRKPISTISYLSDTFLTIELDKMITNRSIDFYAFVNHIPEEDEKKAHKHLFIVPNGDLDTNQLNDTLIEFDSQNPTQPKKCIMWKSSKFGDWWLYSLHDSKYLASKGQSRKYHYHLEDFTSSDYDYLLELVHQIDMSKFNRFEFIQEAVNMGESWNSIVAKGQIPPQQYYGYQKIYQSLWNYARGITDRNGKEGHEDER